MLIIERISEDFAIIEDGEKSFTINKEALPASAKEGDIIIKTNNKYIIDEEETKKRKAMINSLYQKLKKKSNLQ